MAPAKNKKKTGNSAPAKKGTRSTVPTNGKGKGKGKNNRKRHASDSEGSDDNSSDSSDSSDDAPAQPKRKPRKRKKAAVEEHEDIVPVTEEVQIDDEAGDSNVSYYIYT
jgi:hypothetical protein